MKLKRWILFLVVGICVLFVGVGLFVAWNDSITVGLMGNAEQAERIVALGGYISVTLMRSKERRKVINTVPLDRLLVETDSPFIGRNPEAVRDAVAYIAEVKGLRVEEVAETTSANAKRFFGF